MRDQSTAAERYRAIGVRQREGWVDQHIQDFVAGLIRHGFDVDVDQAENGALLIAVTDATQFLIESKA